MFETQKKSSDPAKDLQVNVGGAVFAAAAGGAGAAGAAAAGAPAAEQKEEKKEESEEEEEDEVCRPFSDHSQRDSAAGPMLALRCLY